ncbi:hypothetical protein E3O19_06315 [Cryobacterium algoritolerans]|uniref:DUF7715 domain-containing protein n=1 Tax=Cryobacterium algoritolerans TaxID=1259184 RepID=A0A4R8WZN3_9MICO|nr:hypothetical protein [Cryobacterium algoritolerans]TFC17386.1 hypothetical protein E3O19_06315 [Cryobacterium algoritolerans]
MKVFVATRATQGGRSSDFNSCIEGELVWTLAPCAAGRRYPYGACGCGRSFSGMNSHGTTTTARVQEVAGLTKSSYELALQANFDADGWCSCCTSPVADLVDDLMALAAPIPVGSVLERRLDVFTVRPEWPTKRKGRR